MIALIETAVAPEPVANMSLLRVAELRKTISATRLSLWLQCKLKFYFRYVLQLPKPTTPSKHAGSTVHEVLRSWNLARWRKQAFSMNQSKRLFSSQWAALRSGMRIDWEEGEAPAWHSTWGALELYLKEAPVPADEKPEAVEARVEADLSRQGLPILIGIIDLVRPGGRIVDFKLVGKTPDSEQVAHSHEVQLTSYSVLYRDATGRKESGFELHHLVRTKEPKVIVSGLPPATEQQHQRLFRQIESYQAGLARRDFVPSPGFHCAGCEYLEPCRRWAG